MAKYTELLSDYLATGGQLPTLFSQITGFTELFTAHFYDSEIGAETEPLFAIKLEAKARLKIPLYKARIDEIAAVHTVLTGTPTKVTYTHGDVTHTLGEQDSDTTELPINSASAVPNIKQHSDQTINEDEHNLFVETYGYNELEAYAIIDKLNAQVHDVVNELLNEFNNCFMAIY